MITTAEIVDMIYEYLSGSVLKEAITGGIYPLKKPDDSMKEDVVIGAIDLSNESVQRSTINVNIYVPEIPVRINNKNQKQPNRPRMRELQRIAIPLLKEVYLGGNCSAWFTNCAEIKEPDLDVWKVNIRLEARVHDLGI